MDRCVDEGVGSICWSGHSKNVRLNRFAEYKPNKSKAPPDSGKNLMAPGEGLEPEKASFPSANDRGQLPDIYGKQSPQPGQGTGFPASFPIPRNQLPDNPGPMPDGIIPGRDHNRPITETTPATDLEPDLALLLNVWPSLPEAIRAGIMAMVKAAAQPEAPGKAKPSKGKGDV